MASRAASACAATDVLREMHRRNILGSAGGESACEKGANGGRRYVMVNTEDEMDAYNASSGGDGRGRKKPRADATNKGKRNVCGTCCQEFRVPKYHFVTTDKMTPAPTVEALTSDIAAMNHIRPQILFAEETNSHAVCTGRAASALLKLHGPEDTRAGARTKTTAMARWSADEAWRKTTRMLGVRGCGVASVLVD